MAEIKWIKIVTDIFDDEKILLIESLPDGDSIIVCWFKLLCLAGKQNNSGVLMLNDRVAYTEEMLATVFRRPIQTVRLALETFEQFGMVEIINGAITIPNWGKHQSIDRLEKLRGYQREYHREYRKKQAQIPETVGGNVDRKLYGKVEVNGLEEDIEEDIRNKNKKKCKKKEFTPPTLEEVKAYIEENGYKVDAEYFYKFYSAGNWIDSKGNPVQNWKQKLITWAKKDGADQQQPQKKKQFTTAENYTPPHSTIDVAAYNKLQAMFGGLDDVSEA